MSDEFRPDDSTAAEAAATPLTRETYPPRRDRWLMPLIAAGCTLAGVAGGFVLGQRTALPATTAPALATRGEDRLFVPDFDDNDDSDLRGRIFAFNWHGFERHGLMAPVPPMSPMPPMSPRELVVDGCNGDDDDADCTTIIKRKADGSMVIVKTRR